MKCEECGLNKYANTVCIQGIGPTQAQIMVVGEAPGYTEDEEGKPFQGKAGKILMEMLDEAGFRLRDIYFTNAVKCRPPDNRTPTQKEIKTCANAYLTKEIAKIQPKNIIVLGSSSLKALLNKSGVTKLRGETIEKDGISYHITLHPAVLFRQPQQEVYIKADLARFAKLAQGSLEVVGESLKWTLVDTPAKLRQCISAITKADTLAYDIESSSLNPRLPNAKIYCLGIGDQDRQWVIPFSYPGSPFTSTSIQGKIVRMLKIAMAGKKLVAHNAKFDDKYMKHLWGWCPGHTFDTMLASHLLDENSRNGLKPLSQLYFDAPEYALSQPVDPQQVPLAKLAKYCAQDIFYTMKLYDKFKSELLGDKSLLRIFKNITIPASQTLVEAELEGVYLDPKKYEESLKLVSRRYKDCLTKLNKEAGVEINWNSPAQISLVLFDKLGLEPMVFTAKGAPSTAEAPLMDLKNQHPIAQYLLDYREQKGLMQFLNSWKELMHDNRIHPNFLIHGTVTGRLSCRDPNLQQVPRDPTLRSILTAPPGWTFVEADYSQIELRIAAAISGDVTMRRAYQTRQDLHTLTAASISGVSIDKVTPEMRKKAKAVNFGLLYGMGANGLKEYAKTKFDVHLSTSEAQSFRERFFDLYSGLQSWHERQRRLAKKFRYVRNPLGRKRRLPEIISADKQVRAEAERQSINSPVQGMAVDLAMFAFAQIHRSIPSFKAKPLGNIHDALLYIVKDEYLDEVIPQIIGHMTDMDKVKDVFGYEMPVPIEVEVKLGPWGSGKIWTGRS